MTIRKRDDKIFDQLPTAAPTFIPIIRIYEIGKQFERGDRMTAYKRKADLLWMAERRVFVGGRQAK